MSKIVPDKVYEYLSSYDVEMVQLGANLLTSYKPKHTWGAILEEYRQVKQDINFVDEYTFAIPSSYKWRYEIVDREIIIIAIDPQQGLWSQVTNSTYTSNYTIKTGRGGLGLLQKAIGEYFNKSKPIKAKNEKRKWRKQAY